MNGIKPEGNERYERRIHEGLEKSYVLAHVLKNELPLELDKARVVIFSDHHRGARDSADDFKRCEAVYGMALRHYLGGEYTLIVLGDAEELWESRPRSVVGSYRDSLLREAAFNQKQRYFKISGNHDDYWERQASVQLLLGPLFNPAPQVKENLRILFRRGQQQLGELFLVHGHQGDYFGDRARRFSKFIVRNFWRPIQRITKISLNTPARDFSLHGKHNMAMYRWAEKKKGLVLIAGHTHEPMFESKNHLARLEERLASARAAGDAARAAALNAELERRRAAGGDGGRRSFSMARPCYFNSGCCAFKDGDITGIEIADGRIKIVRWPDDAGNPKPKILEKAMIKDVFDSVGS